MAGGAIGALVSAPVGFDAMAYGVTGLPSYLIANKPLLYTAMLAVSGGVAFVLTQFPFREEQPAAATKPEKKRGEEEGTFVDKTVIHYETGMIVAPVKG